MYVVSQEFRELMDSQAQQMLKGTITLKNGSTIQLTEDNINKPSFTRQCTTQPDVFNFGQMYTSTVTIKVLGRPELLRQDLRSGTIQLWFSVVGLNAEEWVLLGTWNITDPQRDSGDAIIIKGTDNTSKLDVPIENNKLLWYGNLERHLKLIKSMTGLSFVGDNGDDVSGTIAILAELSGMNLVGNPNRMSGTERCKTCRDEVNAIAQFCGLTAYIDREGRIAFRKLGDNIIHTQIPANMRHKINLSEYSLRVGAIGYTYTKGTVSTDTPTGTGANTNLQVNFSDNIYMPYNVDAMKNDLDRILLTVTEETGIWTPGEVDIYGDPTIDLGDIVVLKGGINKTQNTSFLVTAINWQFRGPMTLISAGAAEAIGNGSGSSGSGGSSSGGGGQTVVQKPWTMVDLEGYPQTLVEQWREIGAAMFGVGEETLVIAHLTVNLTGSDIGEVVIHVLLDGVMQTEYSWDTIANGQKLTTGLNVPLTVEGGVHRLTIEAKGAATVDRIVASVYGQGVSEYTGETTFDSEYVYHQDIVDEYIGSSLAPRIPPQLGGNDVHVIGGGSFEGTNIEYASIPEGTEEIK